MDSNRTTPTLRLAGITPESTVDGPGLRFVVFTQGCPHRCPHCHNAHSWDYEGGAEFTAKQVIRDLKQKKKGKRGVTFSGGEPFLQAAELLPIAEAALQLGMDIVIYTGYTYEQLLATNNESQLALLATAAILVDGRYIHALRDIGLRFHGSSNQRVIDMAATRAQGEVVLWQGEQC